MGRDRPNPRLFVDLAQQCRAKAKTYPLGSRARREWLDRALAYFLAGGPP